MVKMEKDAKDGKSEDKEKVSKKKKILVLLIVINIVLVSFVVVWYFNFRPWSIREVAQAAGFENEEEMDIIFGNPDIINPGFSHDLAGKDIKVKGRITEVRTILTTLGPLTYYELDDFKYIHLIEWKPARYAVGDEIEKKVSFEWSQWNDQHNVYSPQLDFPAIGLAPTIEVILSSVSYHMGMILMANQTKPDGPVNVLVVFPYGGGYPLELIDCSLKAGTESHNAEYIDASGGYEDKLMIDSIPSLLNKTGINQTIYFTDANQNDLFDDGDRFSFNLSRPLADSEILTFLFSVNDGLNYRGDRIVGGVCYIIMTNRGVLSTLSTIVGETFKSTYLTTDVSFEYENTDNVTTIIEIEQVLGERPEISDASCNIFFNWGIIQSGTLIDGIVINQNGIVIEFSDNNNNTLIDEGDRFSIRGLGNHTSSEFYIVFESIGTRFFSLDWIIGIGARTGRLPLVYFGDPSLISTSDNGTLKIEIENMYGVPGVNLLMEDPNEWFMVRVEKDDQEDLTPTNLTFGFNEELAEIKITFIDSDENDFINSGDYFICRSNETGEYQLILDYVEEDRWNELGYEIIYSQPVSWTVS